MSGSPDSEITYLARYAGNICIGSTTASEKFTVVGTMSSTGQTYLGTGPDVTVGIGTTTATETLTVDGNALADTVYATPDVGVLFIDGDSTLAIPTAGDYYTFAKWNVGGANGMTQTDSTITIPVDGIYDVRYSISSSYSANTTLIHGSIFVDDVEETEVEAERYIATGADVGCFGSGGAIQLTKGDIIKLKLKADGTGTFTIHHMNLTIKRLN